MSVSRRGFLQDAACFPLARLALEPWRRSKPAARSHCLVLDSSCVLKESLEGYRAGLRTAGVACELASLGNCHHAPFIVAPASSLINFDEARWLRSRAEAGALILVESGGIFLSPADFRRQKSLVQSQFGLTMLPPIKLWETSGSFSCFPYVDFTWPVAARVRDFSQIIPLAGPLAPPDVEGAAAIAGIDDTVVALKRRLGAGTLVFLGSPLGPQLLAGDREARRWFAAFCQQGLE